MARSLLGSCLAFAGVWVLAGPGWALLAGALLVFGLWPAGAENEAVRVWRRAVLLARQVFAAVAGAPRRSVGMGGMAGGLALLPAGLALATGVGTGIAVAGGLLIGLGLLTGWGA